MDETEYEKTIICPKCSRHIQQGDTNFCPSCGTFVSIPKEVDSSAVTEHKPEKAGVDAYASQKDTKPYAGFWIRSGAFWMDILILLLISMFFGSLVYSTAPGRHLFPNIEKINLFMVILFIFYHGIFLGRFNTTPGKKFFGLCVEPIGPFSRLGYPEAFLRTLSYFVSEFFLGMGFFWIAFDRKKQGWHDKIAKTCVFKSARVPIFRRLITLILLTFMVFIILALQFNITWVYQSVLNPGNMLFGNRGKEIISVLVTHKEIRDGVFKEINTRAGSHTIRIPSSARDGEIFQVNRDEEEGGVFYIKIVIVENI